MGMLILESIGDRGGELANEAAEAVGVPAGFDPDLDSVTFDSDQYDDEDLRATVTEALDGIDPDWSSHLRIAE